MSIPKLNKTQSVVTTDAWCVKMARKAVLNEKQSSSYDSEVYLKLTFRILPCVTKGQEAVLPHWCNCNVLVPGFMVYVSHGEVG